MIDLRIVRRYATALFNSAQSAGAIDLVESDLGLISYTFESNPQLKDAMVSPLIPCSKKKEIVTSIFQGKIQDVTLYYLYLLIDNRREGIITETEAEYIRIANEARGIMAAEVTAAIELTPEEIINLRAKLSVMTGKQVDVVVSIDPSIIGGLVVRIGDTVIDGSITGQLAKIKNDFLGKQ